MRLYVQDTETHQKVFLDQLARTRVELAQLIGGAWFSLQGKTYHVNQVIAESGENNTATGAIVGGLIGLLAGPAGVILGGVIGGTLGKSSDNDDLSSVRKFNQSAL